jgi:hypothetical protein
MGTLVLQQYFLSIDKLSKYLECMQNSEISFCKCLSFKAEKDEFIHDKCCNLRKAPCQI